jgi:hypothetical protein
VETGAFDSDFPEGEEGVGSRHGHQKEKASESRE